MSWQPHGFAVTNPEIMLDDYRTWLESELKLLGNASHHAYSFGQANMAKRAIDRFDESLAGGIALVLSRVEARVACDALDAWPTAAAPVPDALSALRDRLRSALATTATRTGGAGEPLREEPPVV